MARRRIHLAWLNLTNDPSRLATSLAGIAFAVVLMSMEIGFRNALLDSTAALIDRFNADLVLISRTKTTLVYRAQFNRRVLNEALRFPGVERAVPVYLESRQALLRCLLPPGTRAGATAKKIRVVAYDPRDRALWLPGFDAGTIKRLEVPDTALFDEKSRGYGTLRVGEETELARRTVRLIGSFRLGTDFATDGTLVMSDRNFLRYFPDRRLDPPELRLADLGLVTLAPGADAERLRAALEGLLKPEGVLVFTKADYAARERQFWDRRTPVGIIFGIGTLLGLVVGAVICYQILSSDIADHLPEYATLKAIGRSNGSLMGIVFQEALLLSVFGYIPGILLSWLLYRALAASTGLLLELTWARAASIFGLTLVMCLSSGLVAIRKLFHADPAELF